MRADSKNASTPRKFNVTANLTFGFVVVTFLWTSFSYAIATNTSSPAGSIGPLRRKQLFSAQSKNRPGSGIQTRCGPLAGYPPIVWRIDRQRLACRIDTATMRFRMIWERNGNL
jgi:hypothetical protein